MRPRWLGPTLVAVLLFLFLLSSCAKAPTQEPLPTPSPQVATEAPATLVQTVESEVTLAATPVPPVEVEAIGPGQPGVVPILYKMFDYGSDFQKTNPEYGPVGSIHWVLWRDINPDRDAFNWPAIDDKLALEAPLKVTLPDGRQVPKPVVIQIMVYISSAPGWNATFYDGTPQWVYNQMDRLQPDDPRPVVSGMKVGYTLEGCGQQAVVPAFDNQTWRDAYFKMVQAVGERYNDHPQITAVVVCTGLDGETQVIKDWGCSWSTLLDQQASGVRYRFNTYVTESMDAYHEAFPNKTLFINNAPGGSGMRKSTSDYAATFDPPIGLKHSGLWVDLDSHQGYGNFYGSFDMINAYSETLPIWLESVFGMGSSEHRYWSLMAGLNYHPDAIDCHPEFFPQSRPEWLRFVVEHLGVTIDNTPDVWTLLRDTEFEMVDWGAGGTSGHMGDWTFWLYRREDAPQSATVRIWRDEMPAAQDHVYSRQTRRTQQDENHVFMSFDIDDRYPYVAHKPIAVAGGTVHSTVHVTLLNRGTDTFSLEYRDWDGAIVSQTRRKGPELGPVDDWVTVDFVLRDAYLDNNMPGGTDFRIDCGRDGDEYIHLVRLEGGWGEPPPPTPTPTATIPPPSATPSVTPTGPTLTPSPTASLVPPPTLVATPTLLPNAVRYDPSDDTYLDQWTPTQQRYLDTRLAVRQGDLKAALLRFELADIPTSAVIEQAVLALAVSGRSNDGNLSVWAHRVLRPWAEREATWLQARDGEPWTVPGCNDSLRDRSYIPVSGITLTEASNRFTLELSALVQEWVKDPARNYGLILKADGRAAVEYSLHSSNQAMDYLQPQLWVTWYDATATPVPPTRTPSLTPTEGSYPKPTPLPSKTTWPTPTTEAASHSVTFRQGEDYVGVTDTFLDAWNEKTNYSRASKMIARQESVRVPLARFDLTSIATGAAIKRARLYAYFTFRSNPAGMRASIARVMRPWDPDYVNWVQTTASEAWGQPGARDTGLDRSVDYYASTVLDSDRGWASWDVAELVQGWVAYPETNHGLIMFSDGSVSVQYDFASSNYSSAYRPYLEVEYVLAAPSPTTKATATSTAVPATPTATPERFPEAGTYLFREGSDTDTYVDDTFVDEWSPTKNYASASKLALRQGGVRSPLLRFNLEEIRPSSYIVKAVLSTYVESRSGPHSLPVGVYALLRPWVTDEATFQRASRAMAWSEAGLSGPGQDIAATPAAQLALNTVQNWVELDVTSLVQDWVRSPEVNHGLVLKAEGNVSVEYALCSSDWSNDINLRPGLSVEWLPAAPTSGSTPTAATPTSTNTASATRTVTVTPTATRPQAEMLFQQGLDGYQGCADTFLDSWNQQGNMGQGGTFSVRQSNVRVGLIRFDLSSIPADISIKDATLGLWSATEGGDRPLYLRAYLMQRPWVEGAANWIEAQAGSLWAGPGASGIGVDRLGEPIAELVVDDERPWSDLDLTETVQYWVVNPGDNYGLLLLAEGGVNVEYQFASAQWWDQGSRPKLQVAHQVGASRAEPGDRGPLWPWLASGGAGLLLLTWQLVRRKLHRSGSRASGRLIR